MQFHFYSNLIVHSVSKHVASDLGLHCLPVSHKKYARLIWVNEHVVTHTVYHGDLLIFGTALPV